MARVRYHFCYVHVHLYFNAFICERVSFGNFHEGAKLDIKILERGVGQPILSGRNRNVKEGC